MESVRGFVYSESPTLFDIPTAMRAWCLGASLPERIRLPVDEGTPWVGLHGLSPACTKIVTFYNSTRPVLRVNDAKHGGVLARLPLDDDGLGGWIAVHPGARDYNLIFDSETRFYLKIYKARQNFQIPFDIVPASRSGEFSHEIIGGGGGNQCLCQNPGQCHRTLSTRIANGPSTHSPEKFAGFHRGIYGGEMVDIFGLVCPL